jgi:hypothetical protein
VTGVMTRDVCDGGMEEIQRMVSTKTISKNVNSRLKKKKSEKPLGSNNRTRGNPCKTPSSQSAQKTTRHDTIRLLTIQTRQIQYRQPIRSLG